MHKKLSLEVILVSTCELTSKLGGKNPSIVFDDIDLDKVVCACFTFGLACLRIICEICTLSCLSEIFLTRKAVPDIVRSCFTNQGEICLCASRLYVQRAIFDEFVVKFVVRCASLRL